jgi:sugar phosphate isomerase/epimerase
MRIAISTGTFYQAPFARSLEWIRQAGFEYIELLAHWEGGDGWAMAQNLKGLAPREVLRIVRESGLKISSLHDGGGVIEAGAESVIAESTAEYLEHGAREIPCVVFHTPHKKTANPRWWEGYRAIAGADLRQIAKQATVCVENLFRCEGYQVPLLEPEELLAFAREYDIYVNLDTVHCAQAGQDLPGMAKTLRERVYAVHLSDYAAPAAHVFAGEGTLPLRECFTALEGSPLRNVTLECDIASDERVVARLRQARIYTRNLIAGGSAGIQDPVDLYRRSPSRKKPQHGAINKSESSGVNI